MEDEKKFECVLLSQYNLYLKENEKYFKWIAIKEKFYASNIGEKIKLIIKIFLQIFGIHFSLDLEFFERDKKICQNIQDMGTYISLKEKYKSNKRFVLESEEKNTRGQIDQNARCLFSSKCEHIIRTTIEKKDTYIALMVENLDVGGLEEVVKLLALELKKRNLKLKVFCTYRGGRTGEELKREGIDVLIFGRKKNKFENYIRENPPLVINSHYVIDFMDVIEKYNIPLVETIHNMYVFLPPKRLEKEQRKSKIVTEYIAVSNAAARVFNNKIRYIDSKNMHIIGNTGKEFNASMIKRERGREYYNLPKDAFIFLVVGTIDARKNQIGIVRAWNILAKIVEKEIALVFAGTCKGDDYEKQIRRFIKEWNLENIYILDYCDRVTELMEISDALIVNSYYEGWSMAATEALYSGLPLIHSDCGSGVELIAEGRNGVLISNPLKDIDKYTADELWNKMKMGESDNIYELVTAMLILLDNYEKKYNKEKISNYAKEKFSVKKMIDDYLEVYSKACKMENN